MQDVFAARRLSAGTLDVKWHTASSLPQNRWDFTFAADIVSFAGGICPLEQLREDARERLFGLPIVRRAAPADETIGAYQDRTLGCDAISCAERAIACAEIGPGAIEVQVESQALSDGAGRREPGSARGTRQQH